MNEEAIKDAYSLFANTGYNGSYDDFKQLIQSNPEARSDAYGLFTNTGYNGSQQDFDQLMGVGGSEPVKKKRRVVSTSVASKARTTKAKARTNTPVFGIQAFGYFFGISKSS